MANTILGKVCVVPKGAWDSSNAYDILDIVSYDGGAYLSKQDVPSGTAITNTAYWMQIVKKGDQGDVGLTPDLSIGTVTTLDPGDNATVTITGTEEEPVLNFGLPKGQDGEVTNASLAQTLLDYATLSDAYNSYPHDAKSGTMVTIPDGADGIPVRDLSVAFEPVQDLHGYANPWVGGGGKNKLQTVDAESKTENDVAWTVNSDGSIKLNGTASARTFQYVHYYSQYPSGEYIATCSGLPANVVMAIDVSLDGVTFDSSLPYVSSGTPSQTITLDGSKYYAFYIDVSSGAVCNNVTVYPMLRLSSESDDTWVPYENICPITGWTGCNVFRTGDNILGGNLLRDGVLAAISSATDYPDDRYVTYSYSAAASQPISNACGLTKRFKPNTQYTFIFTIYKNNGTASNLGIYYTDGTNDPIPALSAAQTKETVVFVSDAGKTVQSLYKRSGGGVGQVYYDESGIFEGVLTASDFKPYVGNTYPVSWQSEAGTVYGGTWNPITGKLVADRMLVSDLGQLNWTRNTSTYDYAYFYTASISNMRTGKVLIDRYKYMGARNALTDDCSCGYYNDRIAIRDDAYTSGDGLKTSLDGVSAVVRMSTPVEYTLTSQQISTLLGNNNIWSDCGDVSLDYRADPTLYIQKLTMPSEDDMVANANIASGIYFMVGNELFLSTASIANGEAIVVGTNCTRVSLAQALNAINS